MGNYKHKRIHKKMTIKSLIFEINGKMEFVEPISLYKKPNASKKCTLFFILN